VNRLSASMADPTLYTYPSPLKGYENLQPLPEYVIDLPPFKI